jgi:uncharacterized protein (TIGR02996 family)
VTADAETRAEVLAEVRQVLAALKARLAAPPAVTYPETVSWDTPATSTPLADFAAVAEAFGADPAPTVLRLLERLAYLLELTDLEREFFEACASDGPLDAFDGRLAYADWLEERGDGEGALRVRKLTPQPGDVLLGTLPGDDVVRYGVPPEWDACLAAVQSLQAALRRRGVETTMVLLPPGATLTTLNEFQMMELGWVRAERLAGEGRTAETVTTQAMAAWRRAEDSRLEAYSRTVRAQAEAYLARGAEDPAT